MWKCRLKNTFIWLLYWHHVRESIFCYSFEDRVPVDSSNGWPIFKWVTGNWLKYGIMIHVVLPVLAARMTCPSMHMSVTGYCYMLFRTFIGAGFYRGLVCQIRQSVNTLRPRQNGRRFPDDIFKCIFLNENARISINISLKFVRKSPINNIPALVLIMAWRRPGDKPLSEPMLVISLTHICVTRPQWVKFRLPCMIHPVFMDSLIALFGNYTLTKKFASCLSVVVVDINQVLSNFSIKIWTYNCILLFLKTEMAQVVHIFFNRPCLSYIFNVVTTGGYVTQDAKTLAGMYRYRSGFPGLARFQYQKG